CPPISLTNLGSSFHSTHLVDSSPYPFSTPYEITMSTSATLDPTFSLDNSMGAMLIGVIISAVLHGITLLQAFTYWTNYKKDVWYLKTLRSAVLLYANHHSSDKESLRFITWTVLVRALSKHHICETIVPNNSFVVGVIRWKPYLLVSMPGLYKRFFYTLRVFRLSKRNYWLSGTILFLILATTGSGTAWVIVSPLAGSRMQFETYEQLLSISPLTITINALSTVVDITIAASLCIMLHNARTGFKRSDSIINKLIVFIVNTGVLTTCCAIASLICLIASPKSLIYATFYFCIGRLYTNSFLATLNARNSFTSNIDENTSTRMMSSMPAGVVSPHPTVGSIKMKNITIRIDTSTTKEGNRTTEHSDDHMHSQSGKSDDIGMKNGPLY
ncbi:hypothetical protein CVT25_001493, partial [Psilocybe cyanescens]